MRWKQQEKTSTKLTFFPLFGSYRWCDTGPASTSIIVTIASDCGHRKWIQSVEFVLVCARFVHATRLLHIAAFDIWPYSEWHLVLFHIDYCVVVHGQFCGAVDNRSHGNANQFRRRFGSTARCAIWNNWRRFNHWVFQGNTKTKWRYSLWYSLLV